MLYCKLVCKFKKHDKRKRLDMSGIAESLEVGCFIFNPTLRPWFKISVFRVRSAQIEHVV